MTESFDVFLSHNSKDKLAIRKLAEVLRARGLKVWLDEWELVPGRPWQEALEEVIETTRAAAVLVGKDGLGPWQDKEMRGCLAEFVARDLPVIPVLLPGAPEEPVLPIFLKRFTWVDLRSGLNEEEGVDRLQWGITGEKPDRSKPMLVYATTSEAAVTSHPREGGQGDQRRPRVMVECFRFIAYEDESGEDYYVEALRVINLGEAPAVSIHLDLPEFSGWAVRLRKKPPSILRPGEEADIELSGLEKMINEIRKSPFRERGQPVKIPLKVEYRDVEHRRWSTDHAIACTTSYDLAVEMVHPDEPPEWTDLAALAKAASEL